MDRKKKREYKRVSNNDMIRPGWNKNWFGKKEGCWGKEQGSWFSGSCYCSFFSSGIDVDKCLFCKHPKTKHQYLLEVSPSVKLKDKDYPKIWTKLRKKK